MFFLQYWRAVRDCSQDATLNTSTEPRAGVNFVTLQLRLKKLLFLSILCFCGCAAEISNSEHDESFEHKIMAIADAVRSSSMPAKVRFSELTSHSWDRVYIFHAYYPWEAVQTKLGCRWDPQGGVGFQQVQDGHAVVAFIKDGRVTHHSNLSPLHGDFGSCTKKSDEGYTPDNAIFELRRVINEDGPWVVFSESN